MKSKKLTDLHARAAAVQNSIQVYDELIIQGSKLAIELRDGALRKYKKIRQEIEDTEKIDSALSHIFNTLS